MYRNKYWLVKMSFSSIKFFRRRFTKLKREQGPEDIKNMLHFQHNLENSMRNYRIYLWGSAITGALGKSNFIIQKFEKGTLKTIPKPWRHPFADVHEVKDLACGYDFTVIATSCDSENYSLFGTGLNSDGQLGYQCNKYGKILDTITEPVPIPLPVLSSNTNTTHVACGRAHTVILTDKDGAFSLGNNAYGQCGISEMNPNKFKVYKIEDFGDVSKVVCGLDHTLFLMNSGKVFSCGWSADGQTGLGHYRNQHVPSCVIGDIDDERIIQLSCTADCVLALSDKGEVFGWGNSEYGQFASITDKQQVNVSRHLKLNVGKIKSIASGGTICAVLNEEGHVYVWGYGILGHGLEVTSLSKPTLLSPSLFDCKEFSSDLTVKQIECGLSHFAAINSEGHLYMWGRNQENCLGLGRSDNQYFPFRVSIPDEVIKVCCGVRHTGVICRSSE